MASVNKVILVGNLGKDPELKTTTSGKAVCSLSVATSYKGGGEEKTEWHKVNVWDKQAEACARHLHKGSSVYVEGRIETRTWDKDGVKQYSTEIVAERVQFLGGKKEGF